MWTAERWWLACSCLHSNQTLLREDAGRFALKRLAVWDPTMSRQKPLPTLRPPVHQAGLRDCGMAALLTSASMTMHGSLNPRSSLVRRSGPHPMPRSARSLPATGAAGGTQAASVPRMGRRHPRSAARHPHGGAPKRRRLPLVWANACTALAESNGLRRGSGSDPARMTGGRRYRAGYQGEC